MEICSLDDVHLLLSSVVIILFEHLRVSLSKKGDGLRR